MDPEAGRRLINSGLDSPEALKQKNCRGPATFNRFYLKAEQRDPMRFTRDVICCTPHGASRI